MNKKIILLPLFIFISVLIYSQTESNTQKEKVKFKTGIEFLSNQTYAGRTDSLKLPVLIPSVSLYTPGGFYTKLKGYYNLSSGNSGFDGVSIEPGYEISKEHWDVSFSLIKNFISDSSNLLIAPIKTSLEFYAGNRNPVINPYLGAEYLFTKEGNDFIMYGGLSKNIVLSKKDKEPEVSLEPSFSLTGGTQTFYYSFVKNYAGNGKSKGRGRGGNPPVVISQTVETESRKFTLLAAEVEFPLSISSGKFECKIVPTWVSPINLVDKGAAGTQQAKSYVYLDIELLFTL